MRGTNKLVRPSSNHVTLLKLTTSFEVLQTCSKALEFRSFQHQLYCNQMEHKLSATQKQLQEAEARAAASEKRAESMRQVMDHSQKEIASLRSELATKKRDSTNLIGTPRSVLLENCQTKFLV